MGTRRVAIFVAVCVLVGACAACGASPRPRTLDNEPDLVTVKNVDDLRTATASDVQRLIRPCRLLTTLVEGYLDPAPAALEISDVQCHWRSDLPVGRHGGPPEIVLGIVPDGTYRFHETEKLLDDERRVGGVGTDAIYAPQSRTVFCVRNGRLWYVQMVGTWAPKFNPQVVTSTLALRLMNERETE